MSACDLLVRVRRSWPASLLSSCVQVLDDQGVDLIPTRYQKRLGWARAALLMQGLEEESVSRALDALTNPVELDVGREQHDEHDEGVSLDQTDTARPQRQGNPAYDPLAELCPGVPRVKFRRRDGGEEQRLESSEPPDAHQHVLVDLSEEERSASSATPDVSDVNNTTAKPFVARVLVHCKTNLKCSASKSSLM